MSVSEPRSRWSFHNTCSQWLQYQSTAILALQEAAKDFLVRMFYQVNDIAICDKLVTIQQKHIQLWKRLFDFDNQ